MPSGPVHSLQGLFSFVAGGLLAAVVTLAAGLQDPEWVQVGGQYLGFGLGGALGGAGLAFGFPGRRAWAVGAAGFAVGFLIPAFIAAPVLMNLIAMDFGGRSESGSVASAALAFGGSYAAAGAVGMGALGLRWVWSGALRFLAAGMLGGLVAASVPAYVASRFESPPPEAALASIACALGGHLLAFGLGGFWTGRRLEAGVAGRDADAKSGNPR